VPTVAINGLGRIGRAALKILLDSDGLELAAVNDIAAAENLAYRSYSPRVDGRCRWSAATWTGPCGHGEGSWHAVGVSQG
jgi:glyceraldehyde 3-phosphate dehydrogenase